MSHEIRQCDNQEARLAAHAAGVKCVVLPARNCKDFEDIPEETRKALEFVWLNCVDDALDFALRAASSPQNAEPAGA